MLYFVQQIIRIVNPSTVCLNPTATAEPVVLVLSIAVTWDASDSKVFHLKDRDRQHLIFSCFNHLLLVKHRVTVMVATEMMLGRKPRYPTWRSSHRSKGLRELNNKNMGEAIQTHFIAEGDEYRSLKWETMVFLWTKSPKFTPTDDAILCILDTCDFCKLKSKFWQKVAVVSHMERIGFVFYPA